MFRCLIGLAAAHGVDVPVHLAQSEDEVREEPAVEVALAEVSTLSLAVLEERLRAQVKALAETHAQMEKIRAELNAAEDLAKLEDEGRPRWWFGGATDDPKEEAKHGIVLGDGYVMRNFHDIGEEIQVEVAFGGIPKGTHLQFQKPLDGGLEAYFNGFSYLVLTEDFGKLSKVEDRSRWWSPEFMLTTTRHDLGGGGLPTWLGGIQPTLKVLQTRDQMRKEAERWRRRKADGDAKRFANDVKKGLRVLADSGLLSFLEDARPA